MYSTCISVALAWGSSLNFVGVEKGQRVNHTALMGKALDVVGAGSGRRFGERAGFIGGVFRQERIDGHTEHAGNDLHGLNLGMYRRRARLRRHARAQDPPGDPHPWPSN